MRVALCQVTSSDDPDANAAMLAAMVSEAAAAGAGLVCTPEVSNCVSLSRARQRRVLRTEAEDPVVRALSAAAAERALWIALGSVAVLTDDAAGRFANRSLLIDPEGRISARYDKLHMFDVAVSETETYRESAGFRPGTRAVVADTPMARLGLTICYDLRFPHLYRDLAKAGAGVILVPSAFSPVTGAAHWETLLRARAIETGCFVVAAAQTGTHPAGEGDRRRSTHGHSLVVSPWGEVRLDAGVAVGVSCVDLDLSEVDDARRRLPSLSHDADYEGP